MESLQDIKHLISDAKNICVIPSQGTILHPASPGTGLHLASQEPESLTAALALFYTLRELHKNVNLVTDNIPETFNFLVPPLDFISQPKDFVISIPKHVAEVSQVYYEKNEENLKIHLTIDKGAIKKDNLSFYFSDAKPDLTITVGIQDFRKELENKLDSFGFLLDSPIVNIDSSISLTTGNNSDNTKFGKVNVIEEASLAQMMLEIITSFDLPTINKNTANCLLTGLTLHYENFQSPSVSPEVFELCAKLMKQGADRAQIMESLYPQNKNLPFDQEKTLGSPEGKPLDIVTS